MAVFFLTLPTSFENSSWTKCMHDVCRTADISFYDGTSPAFGIWSLPDRAETSFHSCTAARSHCHCLFFGNCLANLTAWWLHYFLPKKPQTATFKVVIQWLFSSHKWEHKNILCTQTYGKTTEPGKVHWIFNRNVEVLYQNGKAGSWFRWRNAMPTCV